MRINRVKIRNYRKFKEAELELGEGIISINGRNGAGKSSLVEAIAWALYGNNSKILRDGKKGVKYAGAAPSDICSVEIEFEIGGENYRLVREMRGKAGSMVAEIWQNGMSQASSDGGVTDFIEKALGLDAVGFMISVFARQKELNALSNLGNEERKRYIQRMLGLDAIDKAKKKMSEDKKYAKSGLEGMKLALYAEDGSPVIDGKNKRLREIEIDVEKLKKESSEMKKKHEKLSAMLEDAENSLKKMRELKEKAAKIEADIDKFEGYIRDRERAIVRLGEEIKGIEGKKKEIEAIKDVSEILSKKEKELGKMRDEKEKLKRLKGLKARKEKLAEEIEGLRSAIDKYETDIEDMRSQAPNSEALRREYDSLIEGKNRLESERNALISEMQSLKKEIEKLDKGINEISSLGPDSRCPTCHRVLGIEYVGILADMEEEKKKHLSAYGALKKERDEKEAKIEGLKEKISLLREKTDAAERLSRSIENLKNKVEARRENLERYTEDMKDIESEMDGMGEISFDETAYESLTEEISELREKERKYAALSAEIKREPELRERMEKIGKEAEDFRSMLSALKDELKALNYSENDMKEALNLKNSLLADEREMHAKLRALHERSSSLRREKESLKEEIGGLDRKMKEMEKHEEELRYIGALESLMKDFRTEAISGIRPALESIASDLFARITDGKYAGIELDENYEIRILDSGQAHSIKRFSGGESDLANLCLRLAISEVVVRAKGARGFNFLVLDEIFGSQDTSRRENILKALQSLSKRFSQIFLISHIEGIKESASMVVDVEETDSGESKLVIES